MEEQTAMDVDLCCLEREREMLIFVAKHKQKLYLSPTDTYTRT